MWLSVVALVCILISVIFSIYVFFKSNKLTIEKKITVNCIQIIFLTIAIVCQGVVATITIISGNSYILDIINLISSSLLIIIYVITLKLNIDIKLNSRK